MREAELPTHQLLHACRILFGPQIDISPDFIKYLQMPGLKAAFRKKALETHPDRSVSLALQTADLEEQFKEVSAAYRALFDYLENPRKFRLVDDSRRKGHSFYAGRAYQKPRTAPGAQDWAYQKYQQPCFKTSLPERAFLFGRYLHHQGLISYKQLIDAIIWQKVQRPLIGHLARRWRWLHDQDIADILKRRQWGEKFGECALRNSYLTPHELVLLLGRQRLLQPRIGKYFVEKRILTVSTVESMAEALRRHNWKYRSR